MTRLSLLGALAISATLITAATASAKPIGSVSGAGSAAAVKPAGHAPKARCAHNGASTNKAGHLNCRRTKSTGRSGTGDGTPVAAPPSTGDGNPTETPPTTSSGSDQGDQNAQGTSADDHGDQNDRGDDNGSSGSEKGDQNDQGSSSGGDNQQ
jgi:hypothetical protein